MKTLALAVMLALCLPFQTADGKKKRKVVAEGTAKIEVIRGLKPNCGVAPGRFWGSPTKKCFHSPQRGDQACIYKVTLALENETHGPSQWACDIVLLQPACNGDWIPAQMTCAIKKAVPIGSGVEL